MTEVFKFEGMEEIEGKNRKKLKFLLNYTEARQANLF